MGIPKNTKEHTYGTKAAGWKILCISGTPNFYLKHVTFGSFNSNLMYVKFMWLNWGCTPRNCNKKN